MDAIISGHSHKVVLAEVNHLSCHPSRCKWHSFGETEFEVKQDAGKYTIQYIGGDTIRVAGKGNSVIDSLVNKEMDKYGFEEVLTTAENDLIHDRNINKKIILRWELM